MKNVNPLDTNYQMMETSDPIYKNLGYPCRWCGDMTGSSNPYCSDQCRERFLNWLMSEPSSIRGVKPPFWNVIRRLALERDGNICKECGSDSELSVHHIIPLSEGGDSTLDNLRVLCHCCHQKEHGRRVYLSRKKRFRIRIHHKPMYLPINFFGDWMVQQDNEIRSKI